MPRAAPDLAPFHAHGGRIGEARAVFGGNDWIDLSTGIAPWSRPIVDLPLRLDRLPEPGEIAALEAAAAAAFGVGASRVVAVPGTDLAMRLLAAAIPSQAAAVVQPGYAGHRAAWPGARAIVFDELPDQRGHDLVILASPANPDGRVANPALIAALAMRATVLLDQAYADPEPAPTGERLVVLRSFGKFYGLPGLRLGFVIAPAELGRRLRELLGDWPVSSAAVAIGTAAYRDRDWQDAQAARIAAAADALDAVLARHGMMAIVGRAPLFRLVAVDGAERLFRHLARRAILTRPFADQPDRLRIGLPADDVALARLATALEEYRP